MYIKLRGIIVHPCLNFNCGELKLLLMLDMDESLYPTENQAPGVLFMISLQWRHNGRDSISNHQPHNCLLNHYSDANQRNHQSSASLAFVWGIHRGRVNSPHKWPVMQKMFPFDDIIMKSAVVQIITNDRPLSKPVIMMPSAIVICWSWLWLTLNNSNHMFSHIWPDRIRHFDQISDLTWPRMIMA